MKITKYLHFNLSVALPLLTLLITLFITHQAFNSAKIELEEKTQTYFDFRVREATSLIKHRMHVYEQVLQGASGLFKASTSVERNGFKQYVTTLNLAKNYTGIQGVGFSLIVPPEKKTQYAASIRSEGFPEFTVWPKGQRDTYTSIIYLEPFDDRNQRAFGYDMFSEPVRHAAMQKAIDTGQAQLSGKIKLVQETGEHDQSGFLMYLPVYLNVTNNDTLSERREHILGWVYSPFRMNDLMSGLFGEQADDLNVQVFDGESMSNEALMYDSYAVNHMTTTQLEAVVKVHIADHPWTVRIRPLPVMNSRVNYEHPNFVAIIGIILSVMFSVLIWFLVTGRQQVAQALIKSQSQLSTLVNSIPDLIWLKDKDGTYLSCNPSFEKLFGAKEADIIGKTDYDFVDKELADFFRKYDKKVMSELVPSINEEMLTFADSSYQGLFETIKTPMLDEEGKVMGVLGVARDITKRKILETSLKEKEERLALATRHNGVGVWDLNLLTSELIWDDTMFMIFNIKREDFSGAYEAGEKTIHPDDLLHTREELEDAISGKNTFDTDFRILCSNGDIRHIKALAKVFHDEDGKPIRVLGTNMDITLQKQAEEKLQLSSRVFSDTHEGITITNAQKEIVDVNPAFSKITGFSRKEVLGKNPRILSSGKQTPEFYADMWKSINDFGHWQGEVWNRRKGGELYAELLTVSTLLDDNGKVINYVGVFTDITQSKQQQEKLGLMAHYDLLTKLPNRALFTDRFHQAIAHSKRSEHQLAVCFLDLDNFKPVNDNYGHDVGDQLLIEVAQRIKSCIREEDTVSRQGGDEFTLLLNDIESYGQCENTLKRILHALAQPYLIGNTSHHVTASIGVTLYPDDNEDIDTLIRYADNAMYQAKQSGKHRYHFFDSQRDRQLVQKHHRLDEIQQALINNEFQLYYQPKVNMVTGEVFGAEALIRWIHPEKGLIPPLDFLPLIDATDLELQIGDWVINQALQKMEHWFAQGIKLEVSVNIASHHLQSASFCTNLEAALAQYPAVEPQYLQLEILESSVLSDLEMVSQIVKTCQDVLGVSVALDDFGTGYSSLTHLRSLTASIIKIDQGFVRDMLDDPNDYTIIDGVIGLADSFGREVIAEGVETTEHGLMLLMMGCEEAQGYAISKPMPANDMPTWLSAYTPNKEWFSCGNRVRTEKETTIKLFRLITEHWKNKFVLKVQSSPEDNQPWPNVSEKHAPSGQWIKRAHKEGVFEREGLAHLKTAHDNVHFIAQAIQISYQEGDVDKARGAIEGLMIAYSEMTNAVGLCE